MKMKELCQDDRPREKMLSKGKDSLSNAELLAILLRTGTGGQNAVETARSLLQLAGGSLSELSGLSVERMCGIAGIGSGKAATIAAALELGRRAGAEKSGIRKVSVTDAGMVWRMMRTQMKEMRHEECWVIYLNRANYVMARERFSIGGLESTVVDVKMIVRTALEKLASGIILVHNHPSGNPLPGSADIRVTERLKKALDTFDISLVDHVIVCDDRYYREEKRREERTGPGKADKTASGRKPGSII